jgi:hypothetical protein
MIAVREKLKEIKNYILDDYRSSKLRFFLEVYTWSVSLVTSIIFALTVPTIPVIPLYSIYISGCIAASYCAWSRGSFGLLINYLILVSIDAFGLINYLIGTL